MNVRYDRPQQAVRCKILRHYAICGKEEMVAIQNGYSYTRMAIQPLQEERRQHE